MSDENVTKVQYIKQITEGKEERKLTENEIKNLYLLLQEEMISSVDDVEDYELEKVKQDIDFSIKKQYKNDLCKVEVHEETSEVLLLKVKKLLEDDEMDHFTVEEREYLTQRLMGLLYTIVSEYAPGEKEKAYEREDVEEACYLGLVKALNKYNRKTNQGTFGSYVYKAMRNAVVDMIRKEKNREDHIPSKIFNDDGDMGATDITSEEKKENEMALQNQQPSMESKFVMKEFITELEENLNDEEVFIMHHYYMGAETRMTQMELAEFFHVDKKEIARRVLRLKRKMVKIANELNITIEDFV